jgi:hypothetical protein
MRLNGMCVAAPRAMHWRFHMMAIVLAGGSVTTCSDASEVDTTALSQGGESTAVDASARTPEPPSTTPIRHVQLKGAAPSMGYAIPPCNANPDPCCRNPDLPGCHADAGASGDDAEADAGEADDAHSPDACSSHASK